jgi:hypothetical protein
LVIIAKAGLLGKKIRGAIINTRRLGIFLHIHKLNSSNSLRYMMFGMPAGIPGRLSQLARPEKVTLYFSEGAGQSCPHL